jgi:hypothetical protein
MTNTYLSEQQRQCAFNGAIRQHVPANVERFQTQFLMSRGLTREDVSLMSVQRLAKLQQEYAAYMDRW